MVPETVTIATLVLMAASLLIAAVAGGKAERVAALIIFLGTAITWTAQGVPGRTPELAFLVIDVFVGLGLLAVFIRSRLLWAGVACCAQLLMLAFTATRFFNFPLSEDGYLVMLQVSSVIVSSALIFGVIARRWKRDDPESEPL